MNKKHIYFFIILFLGITMAVFSFGTRENTTQPEAPPPYENVRVTGLVRLVGSANFPQLIIIGEEHVWTITDNERNRFNDLQHQRVTLDAQETVIELRFANGMPAGVRRELRNVRLVRVEE